MSHYTKYVQNLLTEGFKIMNLIFKSNFRVKDNTKKLCFSDYFYGCLSQKNVRVSVTHFWTLFTHSWISLSTLLNVFPLRHKAKLSTNKEQSVSFQTALTMLSILMLKRAGDRMLPCGTPISCPCSSERVASTLKERFDRKLWIDLGRWP